ncbi:MAG TPA: hypothetical protein VH165_29895 [Kofleriaceae bacterium]|nr:hypothetical protein [Kofleriaceae bacterium]
MSSPKLDSDVCALLRNQLDSFEKLELLSALRAAGRPMSTSEIEIACRFAADTVGEVLVSLTELNVIERDESGSHFRVTAAAQGTAFETLMSVYEDDRSIILSTLSGFAMERIRGMAARAFAGAFVVRKRGENDG